MEYSQPELMDAVTSFSHFECEVVKGRGNEEAVGNKSHQSEILPAAPDLSCEEQHGSRLLIQMYVDAAVLSTVVIVLLTTVVVKAQVREWVIAKRLVRMNAAQFEIALFAAVQILHPLE